MKVDHRPTHDRTLRAAALSGAAVVIVAIAGIDLAARTHHAKGMPKSSAIVVRLGVSTGSAALSARPSFMWGAVSLLLFVMLRRTPLVCLAETTLATPIDARLRAHALARLRRRLSVSLRSGGLYGP